MKAKDGPNPKRPNIDDQQDRPRSQWQWGQRPGLIHGAASDALDLMAISEEASVPHDLMFLRLQPTGTPPPGEGRNVARAAPRRPGCAWAVGRTDPCCQVVRPWWDFSRRGKWTAAASHHLYIKQWWRSGESFAYKASNNETWLSGYQRDRQGLHKKSRPTRPVKP
jgi:hypothetical protein